MTRQSKTYICWLSTRRQENPRRIQKYKYKYKKRVDCIPCWKTVRLLMIQCLTNSILESFSEFLMIFILFCWFLLSTWCLYFCIDRLRLVWLNGCDQQQNRYTLKNKRHKSQCLAYSFCVKNSSMDVGMSPLPLPLLFWSKKRGHCFYLLHAMRKDDDQSSNIILNGHVVLWLIKLAHVEGEKVLHNTCHYCWIWPSNLLYVLCTCLTR